MMAELEIDQSNLPRVQEVCQSFAVLEDGALAHNLQEQEIEQYYTTNIQKNQLVQKDIRVAKMLQGEEEEQQAQHSTLLRQAYRQIEEEDFEYARLIQEDIQRRAEENRRREQDDEEIARRLQEEEEQRERRSSRELEGPSEGNSALHREDQYTSTSSRGQWSPSQNRSGLTEPQNPSSRSHRGHADSFRETRSKWREPLSDGSEDSDTVFSEQASQRHNGRHNTAPAPRPTSSHRPPERSYRSLCSRTSLTGELSRWEEEDGGEREEDSYHNHDPEMRTRRDSEQERSHGGDDNEGCRSSRAQDRNSRCAQERERRPFGRSESVRLTDRSRHSSRGLSRTLSYKDNPDKRVHFREDGGGRTSNGPRGESSSSSSGGGGVWEMLGRVLRERGVSVRLGGDNGAPLQIMPQSRDSQALHGSQASSCGDPRPHHTAFQRASTARHSFHGDVRQQRRASSREQGRTDHRRDRDRLPDNHNTGPDGEGYQISSRDSNYDRRDSRRRREHRYVNGDAMERNGNDQVRRTASGRRRWHISREDRLSSEEEQEAMRRVPVRSQSLSSRSSRSGPSTRDRSRHMAAGACLQRGRAGLDLGALQQVLDDEEIARRLQEEEERGSRRNSESSSPGVSYPEGDFRVAQVAQDEEIARFMQKEEIQTKRRSRELEGPSSWREHRAMMSYHDRRATRDRRVQRERLDSEGLPSPTEDCSPENQPPSPISTIPPAQQIRNIAEELDPTFQARRQSTENFGEGQIGPTCQSLPMQQSGTQDFLVEPTFIPPTKRPTEKSARTKPKEKKENCKQQ